MAGSAAPRFTCDASDAEAAARALGEVSSALASESNARLRAAAAQAGAQLVSALKQSAAASPTPQARIVADAIRLRPGLRVSLEIGGDTSVGSRGTAAGAIVWGSEHGGDNFQAARGGSYWIEPAVQRFAASGAQAPYLSALESILRDAGLR